MFSSIVSVISRVQLAFLSLLIGSIFTLSGCENSAYTDCKNQASQLWDNKQNANNKVYWAAVNKCKENYDQ